MKKIMYFILCSLLAISFVGCGKTSENSNEKDQKEKSAVSTEKKDENKDVEQKQEDAKKETAKKVSLYFVDDQAMYLNKEEVELGEVTPEILIKKLQEGPKEKNHYPAVPKDAEIKINVKENVAYVDLEKNIATKINGGSTGENMFVYSIANTLILNKDLGINEVKFLLDGKDTETINGHMDTSGKFKANEKIVK
ncbi:GerMN domain-containing protein [Clostridium sp. KNHs214]|uniref:GerMN domain-containing protein n=1 Tax=Clostridium sp. KNHs214 TaxID=1540257 RepID=UPI000690123A|nr:GerMN domain-containing protein [Clostridium sp. KNHs214]